MAAVDRSSPMGRRLLFVGRGRKVSRLSGFDVPRLRWGALIVTLVAVYFLVTGITGLTILGSGAPGERCRVRHWPGSRAR